MSEGFTPDDQRWMERALQLAAEAEAEGEVPVGAVLIRDGALLAESFNSPIALCDTTAHAEIRAIRNACEKERNYRLPGTTLYLTLEPCAMCAGAIVHARISRVVIAAREPRAGAGGSVLNVLQNDKLNHRCEVEYGLLEEASATLLKRFFQARRT